MSERLLAGPQLETQIPNPQQHLGPEAGAINFAEFKDRSGEIAKDAVDIAKLTYHGVRIAVAEALVKRGGTTMERMDHKNALYSDIGNLALGIDAPPTPTADGQPAKPRTMFERIMEKRLNARSWNSELKEAQKNMEIRQFGNGGATRSTGREVARQNSNKRKEINQQYRSGLINARQRQVALAERAANPIKVENFRVKRIKGQERYAHKDVTVAAEQPILSRWRKLRRGSLIDENGNRDGYKYGGAINRIQTQHAKAEKHRAKKEEVERKRGARTLPRRINRLQRMADAGRRGRV